jgi:hypothetical protein
MHILWSLALIVGALTILVLGLVGVVQDLLQRGPYEAPLIRNDGLSWPARYQGAAPQPAESRRDNRFVGATWSGHGSSQH